MVIGPETDVLPVDYGIRVVVANKTCEGSRDEAMNRNPAYLSSKEALRGCDVVQEDAINGDKRSAARGTAA